MWFWEDRGVHEDKVVDVTHYRLFFANLSAMEPGLDE
jgi:hypothetical protein